MEIHKLYLLSSSLMKEIMELDLADEIFLIAANYPMWAMEDEETIITGYRDLVLAICDRETIPEALVPLVKEWKNQIESNNLFDSEHVFAGSEKNKEICARVWHSI